jgi:phage baseplate assembly protein V
MSWRALFTRLQNLVSRAVVRRVDDASGLQLHQFALLADETREGVERVQNYGFTSVPLEGAEAVVLFVGGFRDHGLAVAVDDRRHRLKGLQPGEVAIYTDEGDSVVIRRGGTVEVTAATKVVLSAPAVELAGATRAVPKGEDLNTAIATLATAIGTAVGAIPIAAPGGGDAAGTAIATAVSTFQTAAAAALSTKVKLS